MYKMWKKGLSMNLGFLTWLREKQKEVLRETRIPIWIYSFIPGA
jgi:hypothetical protein